VVFGQGLNESLKALGDYGISRAHCFDDSSEQGAYGELGSELLSQLIKQQEPDLVLATQSADMEDLLPRLAASLQIPLVTQVVDLKVGEKGEIHAVRPVANGYFFEEQTLADDDPKIISMLPSVLGEPKVTHSLNIEMVIEPVDTHGLDLQTELLQTIETDPGELDIEEADIVVAGGRGVGKGKSFQIVYELADAIGGSVGGTRPQVDCNSIEFNRQIGQTGKTVTPRLIINCGISGANEYTAGMEKSEKVIAIDKNPKARIFQFADLGVVGDLQEILPLLTQKIREKKKELSNKPKTEK
jgi:electron transfer flavoprotein alpha subunit